MLSIESYERPLCEGTKPAERVQECNNDIVPGTVNAKGMQGNVAFMLLSLLDKHAKAMPTRQTVLSTDAR